jgi:hypothetical protein
MRKTLLSVWLAAACTVSAGTLKVHGYITSVESPGRFAIDDYKITRDDKSAVELDKGGYPDVTVKPEDLRTGVEIEVQGDFNDSTHELHADTIKVFVNDSLQVKRFAVVEHAATLERNGNTYKGNIHADGQTIRVDDETRVHVHVADKIWQESELSAGASIEYEGSLDRDGSIHATRLELFQSGVAKTEQQLFRDSAPKVNADGEISIRGTKYKLVPDAEAQSYVQRIGAQLVPQYYQHELSGGAARKEPFQFYLVANDNFNAHAFPNGIVLVNSGVFRVLTSEAQLAAVLGHEIAHATQEHSLREMEYRKKKGPDGSEKGYAGGKNDPVDSGYSRILENQADRLGLEYMVAAGYDPREAPEVWKQVARSAEHKGGYWDGQDDTTLRRSYLLAELNNNYSRDDYKSYTRDTEEYDILAHRFGNTAVVQHMAQTETLPVAQRNRPGYQPPAPPKAASPEKRYGPNAVNIMSDPEGADVLLNGSFIGKTPMILPTTNVGLPYTLTIQRAGYRPWTGQLVVVPGRTTFRVELFAAQ